MALTTQFSTNYPVLKALTIPFEQGDITVPDTGRVLWLGAREGGGFPDVDKSTWLCQQSFKPFARALTDVGWKVGEPEEGSCYDLVLVLLPRQRDARRILLARAASHVSEQGVVLAGQSNQEGGRSAQADMKQLVGLSGQLSKHKCRVFWVAGVQIDKPLHAQWCALDEIRPIHQGLVTRPGLFAWNRVDTASALLAATLPENISGRVADLGSGGGYLSTRVVKQCPDVTHLDLYEAEARALPVARINMNQALATCGREIPFELYWHDVTQGLLHTYDSIVSNPPFHEERADLPQLGQAFIRSAATALVPGGRFWMVANRHLPYENVLCRCFSSVRIVVEKNGFKVIEACK